MSRQEYDFSDCNATADYTEEYLCDIVRCKYDQVYASQIFKALDLARGAHAGQLRCNNASYIVHPIRVALMLIRFERITTAKVVIAALLHDTLEKTCLKDDDIEQGFDKYVAKLVRSITRNHDAQSLQEKRIAKLQNWQEIMVSSHEVRAIKTFEDLDNMLCWKVIPAESPCIKKIPRWLEEAQEMSLPLAHATNMGAYTLMRQEYEYYVKQGFADQPITI
jgi:guanosine-3',5'-bis(diphosphate) 3'-pyrophosphohydrolase